MNEKKLLNILAFVAFLIFSVLFIFYIEGMIMQKKMSFFWEHEKVITRLYQVFRNGQSLDDVLKDENKSVISLGFYNFFGDPLYLYGNAPKKVSIDTEPEKDGLKTGTIKIQRDFLSPFDPMKRVIANPNELNDRIYAENRQWTILEKEKLIRYVFLEEPDDMLNFYRVRYRVIQSLVVILILIIILFLISIYKRNIEYRSQIEANERLVVLGEAARTLTHEIKNPLSIIRLQSAIIKRFGIDKLEIPVSIINEEVERVTNLTERITDFIRQPLGIPEVLNVSEVIKNNIGVKGLSLNLELLSGDNYILMDKNRFISILDNLISNAIESDSLEGDITLMVKKSFSSIQIIISDRGRGIDHYNLKKLSDPFFTTKSKGSGLGLSIVTSFVHAVNGELHIESTLGEGTVVSISIPRYKIVRDDSK